MSASNTEHTMQIFCIHGDCLREIIQENANHLPTSSQHFF